MHVSILDTDVEIDESAIDAPPETITTQVQAYVRGKRRSFDFDVDRPEGLTGDVMAAMSEIAFGETRTYGELAADLGTAPIAVGQACGRNPVPIVVPCHRVVGSDGSLHGYSAGDGIDTKRKLLDLERRVSGRDATQTRLDSRR